ncbi:regulator receiver domain protein, partial [gut metagenome]
GISIAKEIYENKIPTAVIILTGYADFSFARAAIQYNVVDYITKADVLSGIQSAVQKAKKYVEQYRHTTHVSIDLPLLRKNFLKSVIDGSLYDTDIETGCASYGIDLGGYQVIAIHFLPTEKLEATEKDKFYKSLTNFFSMSFPGKNLYHIFLDKEHFCLLMYGLSGDCHHAL